MSGEASKIIWLRDNTVLLETQVVHGLVHYFLNLLPIRPSLDELIHILAYSQLQQR